MQIGRQEPLVTANGRQGFAEHRPLRFAEQRLPLDSAPGIPQTLGTIQIKQPATLSGEEARPAARACTAPSPARRRAPSAPPAVLAGRRCSSRPARAATPARQADITVGLDCSRRSSSSGSPSSSSSNGALARGPPVAAAPGASAPSSGAGDDAQAQTNQPPHHSHKVAAR